MSDLQTEASFLILNIEINQHESFMEHIVIIGNGI